MWYVEKVDRDMGGGLVIAREGPFEQGAEAIANAELETGVLV